MDTPSNGSLKVPAGRIRMEVASFLASRGNLSAINQDTSVAPEDVQDVIDHALSRFDIKVSAAPKKPRHGWKVSTLVGFIHEHQEAGAGPHKLP